MKRTLFFAFCILHFTFAAPAPAQTTTFLRAPAAAAYSPLDNSPDIVYANHRPGGADSSTAIWEVYGRTSTTTYDVWDIDPGTSDIKTASGGSWTTISEVLEVTKWYDFGSAGLDAVQATSGDRPLLSLNATTNGYPEVVFDGSDDYLATSATTVWGDTQHSTWFVQFDYDLTGAPDNSTLVAKSQDLNNRHGLQIGNNANKTYTLLGTGANQNVYFTGEPTGVNTLCAVWDGTQATAADRISTYLNNVIQAETVGGSLGTILFSGSSPIYIGADQTGPVMNGSITNIYVHDSDSHDSTERTSLYDYYSDY